MNPMIKRQQATQKTLDHFGGKPYSLATRCCVRMARFQFHQLGLPVPILKGRSWRSETGAFRAFRDLDVSDLPAAVDMTGLTRIAPAAAWLGDLVAIPGDEPWGAALAIHVGNGRLLTPFNGLFRVIEPKAFVTAWRLPVG